MGTKLMCYPVFRRFINQANDALFTLGAEWSLIGMLIEILGIQKLTGAQMSYLKTKTCPE